VRDTRATRIRHREIIPTEIHNELGGRKRKRSLRGRTQEEEERRRRRRRRRIFNQIYNILEFQEDSNSRRWTRGSTGTVRALAEPQRAREGRRPASD